MKNEVCRKQDVVRFKHCLQGCKLWACRSDSKILEDEVGRGGMAGLINWVDSLWMSYPLRNIAELPHEMFDTFLFSCYRFDTILNGK